jgi:hypothetical protein
LTVAQTEYDRELKARRDAEAEVTRLRVLLSGQAARLTVLSEDHRRQELRQQLSKELNDNLSGLEHDLSRLKVERDVTLAEVEELSANKRLVDCCLVVLSPNLFVYKLDCKPSGYSGQQSWPLADEAIRQY